MEEKNSDDVLAGKPEFQRSGHADKRPSQDGDGAGAEKPASGRDKHRQCDAGGFFSIDLMDAYEHLGTILGGITGRGSGE